MSEATLLEKLVKMGLPLDAAYTEGQFQYVTDAALRCAKADRVREAKTYIAKRVKQGENFVGGPDPVIQRAVICSEIMEWLDARAAQIEEGE